MLHRVSGWDTFGHMDRLDPTGAVTVDDYAAALRMLHRSAGSLSLRSLERWAARQRAEGRPEVSLPRTTVADMLAGKRLPNHALVDAFVEACGVTGEAKEPWLAARAALAVPPTQPQPERHSAPRSAPWRRRTLLAAAATALTIVAAIAVWWTHTGAHRLRASIGCVPASCHTTSPRLTVHGRLTGTLLPGFGAYLLTRVESTSRWYLGSRVTPASGDNWTGQVGIGNPQPQSHDRDFTVCLYSLPDDALAGLADRQIAYAGAGLREADLPSGRTRLACTAAARLAQSVP